MKKIHIISRMGIWLDHASAQVMDLREGHAISRQVHSTFGHDEKQLSLHKSEALMHHKEQSQQSSFYKKLIDLIRGHDEVILFGPGEAKLELANLIKSDHNFDKVHLATRQADKMPSKQILNYIKDYFASKDLVS